MTARNVVFLILSLFLISGCSPIVTDTYTGKQKLLIDGLSDAIDDYKSQLNGGTITEIEYYDKAWTAFDTVAKIGQMPDLEELSLYGRWQSGKYLNGEISKEEYQYLMTVKNRDLDERAQAQLRQRQVASQNSLNNVLTFLQILSLLGPQSPLAGGPHTTPAPAAQPSPPSGPRYCSYSGGRTFYCW